MRTIKFRGKREFSNEWLTGSLMSVGDEHFIFPEEAPHSYNVYRVNTETIGQYTGANDAYGNEIYEGDILHIPEDDFNGEIKGVVMFEDDSFVVKSIRSNWSALLSWCNRKDHETKHYARPTKVIGNIYDNPELIEE